MHGENPPNPTHSPSPWLRLRNSWLRATVLLYETLRAPAAKPRAAPPANPPPPSTRASLRPNPGQTSPRPNPSQNPMHLFAPAAKPRAAPPASPTPPSTRANPRPNPSQTSPPPNPSQNPMHLFARATAPRPAPANPPTGLRNNNPRGDFNTAPRCGAHTRVGNPCRSPAMPNGRCRMHGGRSTGPRTLEGLNRLRAATTKHGAYATFADRRSKDPNDPFFRHSLRTVLKGTRETLALIRQSGPQGPDPAALLALLRPDPIPIRRSRKPAPPSARPHAP